VNDGFSGTSPRGCNASSKAQHFYKERIQPRREMLGLGEDLRDNKNRDEDYNCEVTCSARTHRWFLTSVPCSPPQVE
jgi:hypothetical protein